MSINPEIPAFANARSSGAWRVTVLTFYQWLGPDGILQYQRAFYQMQHFVQSDWKRLTRLSTYYLHNDWHHYDRAVGQLVPEGESHMPVELKRHHELHYLYEIFFGPMWALHPDKHSMEMKVAWNALWSPDRPHFKEAVSFANAEVQTKEFTNVQRDLFNQLARYVDLISAMFPGLLCDLLPEKYQPEIDKLRLFRDEYELLRDLDSLNALKRL